jgi:hypothetical protein
MSAKPKMPRITEPNESPDLVHYGSDDFSGNVTLCGKTDWIGEQPGEATRRAVTCHQCKSIFAYCNAHSA